MANGTQGLEKLLIGNRPLLTHEERLEKQRQINAVKRLLEESQKLRREQGGVNIGSPVQGPGGTELGKGPGGEPEWVHPTYGRFDPEGRVLKDGRWVHPPPEDSQPATTPTALPVTDEPVVPSVETTATPRRVEPITSPLSGESRPVPPWTPAQKAKIYQSLQRSNVRRSEEQKVGELERQISQIERQRAEMRPAVEMPRGAAGWGEAILSRLSRGDAGAIHAEREAKREKALGVLKSRQEELETRQEGVRGRLKGAREEEASRAKDAKELEVMDAQIKGFEAQAANVSRPTAGNVIPDPENPGKFIREWFDADGNVVFTSREMKTNIDPRSPEGIAGQKELLDYSSAIAQKALDRNMAISQTDAQKSALTFLSQMSKDRLAAAKANADAVFSDFKATSEQKAAAAADLEKQTQENSIMIWRTMQAIGSNPFGPWINMFQQGGGGGPLPPRVLPGERSIIGPAGDILVIRNGEWVPLQ